LLLSTYRSLRDSDSKIFAEKIGVKRINGVYPDLAFSLPLNSTGGAPTKFKQSRSTVGVSPIAANAWTTKDDPIYGKYINELTSLILSLIKRGYKIELFPSQVRMDSPIIEDLQKEVLKRCLKIEYDYLSVNRLTEVSELIRQLSMVDIIIASRLHGVLLSALMKKPVLALSYNPKVNSLMKDIGLSEYCLNIDQFDCRAGLKIFGQIEALRETIEERLTEKVSSYRRSLDMQYRQVFDTGNFLRNREMRFKR
jgi:polysaccharide pyruvyl transferase WcaK-like protein